MKDLFKEVNREAFVKLDVTQLRAAAIMREVPPEGLALGPHTGGHGREDSQDGDHVCGS